MSSLPRALTQEYRPQALWYLLFPAMFAATFAYVFALVPDQQLVHLSNWSSVEGYADCALEARRLLITGCEAIGYPIGTTTFENLVPRALAYWIGSLTPLSYFGSFQLIGVFFLALGVAGCVGLTELFTGRRWPGAVVSAGYLLSPAVFSSPGLPQIHYGAFLLPFLLWLGMLLMRRSTSWRSGLLATSFGVIGGLVIVNISGYMFLFLVAMFTLAGGVAVAVSFFRDEPAYQWCGYLAVLSGFVISALFQRFVFYPPEALNSMPLDFYRGASIDLLAFLVPNDNNALWSRLGVIPQTFGIAKGVVPGRGGQPFIGYLTVALSVVGLVIAFRRRRHVASLSGLTVATLVIVVIALGPALRVNDPWPPEGEAPVGFNARLMPAGEAALEFPWGGIFRGPPLNLARAVHRWQIPLRLALLLLAAGGLAALQRRSKDAVHGLGLVTLTVLLLLESVRPGMMADGRSFTSRYSTMVGGFRTHAIEPVDRALDDGARVLYLPAANDYLASAMGPLADVRTYNISGDKNRVYIRPRQPERIVDAMHALSTPSSAASQLKILFEEDLVDAVVLNEFSLRGASYRWPPSPADERKAERRLSPVLDDLRESCRVRTHRYLSIITDCGGS